MTGLFCCRLLIQEEEKITHWGKNGIHAQNMEYKLLQSTLIVHVSFSLYLITFSIMQKKELLNK